MRVEGLTETLERAAAGGAAVTVSVAFWDELFNEPVIVTLVSAETV